MDEVKGPERTAKSNKGGRPRKVIRRSEILVVRLTVSERLNIQSKARKAGITASEWFRQAAKDARIVPRITDRNDYRRNVQACKDLTLKYGYHIAGGKEAVNRQRLKGADKLKYIIHDAIRQALKTCKNWQELEHELQQNGITIHYKYKGNSDEIQGISFEKDGVKFKGSAIDRSMAFAGIDKALGRSSARHIHSTAPTHEGPLRRLPHTSEPGGESVTSHPHTGKDVLETLLDSRPDSAHYDPFGQALKRKKKKRKRKL